MARVGKVGINRSTYVIAVAFALLVTLLPGLHQAAARADTPTGSTLVPLLPARIVNSSTGLGLAADMSGDQTKTFGVLGAGGVPTSGVTAVVLSVTATTSSTNGYMTLWTAGDPQPAASQMWHQSGERTSNITTLVPSADGKVAIYNSAGTVSIRVDVEGYYTVGASGSAGFFPLTQQRVVDSTSGLNTTQARISTDGTRTFALAGHGGIPATGVSAAVINVTAVNPTGDTYLYVWPATSTRPAATAVQAPAGVTVATEVVTKLSSDGKISVQNAGAPTDFYVDVQGYYTAANGAQGSQYVPLAPKRVVATSAPKPASAHSLTSGNYETFQIAGTNGVPLANVNAVQMVVTVQASSGTANGQVTAFPTPTKNHWGTGTAITYVSPGVKGVNSAILPVSASGTLDVRFSGTGSVDIYIDVYGYFMGTTLPTPPDNVVATPAQGGVTLSWAHPASDGRSVISAYRVTNVQTGSTNTVGGLQTSTIVTGLSPGSSVSFTVAAINSNGTGPESSPSAAVTPTATLGPVLIYSPLYRAGSTTSYVAPQDLPALFWQDANSSTDHYQYVEDGAAAVTASSGESGVSWYPDTGTHTFQVRAVDSAGNTGPWSQITFTITSGFTPAQATDLTSLPDADGSLNLSAVIPSVEGGVIANFYVNGSDGAPIADTPFYSEITDEPGQRMSTLVNAGQYRSAGPVTWWVVTCHAGHCSAPTPTQTTAFGSPADPPTTHQVTISAAQIDSTQLQSQTCTDCSSGHVYLGGGSAADRQALLIPNISQFGPASPIVSATLHMHTYTAGNPTIEEDQVLDPSQVAQLPIEDEEIATAIGNQTAAADGSLDVDVTNLLSIWASGDAPSGGLILKAPLATTTAVEIGSSDDTVPANRPYITVDLADPAAPTTPRRLTAVSGDGGALITWAPPLSTGSAPDVSYSVTAQPSSGAAITRTTTDLFAALTGLTNGAQYDISVRALTAAGQSSAAIATTTPVTIGSTSTVNQAAAQFAVTERVVSDDPSQSVSDLLAGTSASSSFLAPITDESARESAISGVAQLLNPTVPADAATTSVTPLLTVSSSGTTQVITTVNTVGTKTDAAGVISDDTVTTTRAFDFSTGSTPQLTGISDLNDNLQAVAGGIPPGDADTTEHQGMDWQTNTPYAVALKPSTTALPGGGGGPNLTALQVSVVNWAKTHVHDKHENSRDNCTYFASKVMHFGGGYPMLGPSPVFADPLKAWYYKYITYPGRGNYLFSTETWYNAEQLKRHMGHGVRGYWRDPNGNHTPASSGPYENPLDVRNAVVGDLVAFIWPGRTRVHHIGTVTGYASNGEPLLTYQSNDRTNVPVSFVMAAQRDALSHEYPTVLVWHFWKYTKS